MLYLLSPAKSLDYETPVSPEVLALATAPRYAARAAELIDVLRRQSPVGISKLMNLSEALTALNVARYAAWSRRTTVRNSKPAVLAFNGDVYEGLAAASLTPAQLAWAQQHVVILSGLYGALRPLDRLQAYRLEMGTPLATEKGKDLYSYWGDTVARTLNDQQAADKTPIVVNLASQEYFRVVDRKVLKARVIECVFEDWKGGHYKVISFFAKQARGLMARYAIRHRVATPKKLEAFDLAGYGYAPDVSVPDRLVFRRRLAD